MAGLTEELQREIDAWCSPELRGSITPAEMVARAGVHSKVHEAYVAHRTAARGWLLDPRDAEIAQLHRLLSDAKKGATETRRLLVAVESQRDAAIYERNIAIQSLVEMIQHFINPPAPAEEDPAVRAVRVMQAQGVR